MNESPITVKDLAKELNVAPRELLRALRDLGIPAKSMVSDVDPEDLSRVRARVAAEASTTAVTTGGDGVVVRRRRAIAPTSDGRASERSEAKGAARRKGKAEESSAAGGDASKTDGKPSERPSAKSEDAQPEKRGGRSSRGVRREIPPAKIIRRPSDPVPAARIVVPVAKEQPVAASDQVSGVAVPRSVAVGTVEQPAAGAVVSQTEPKTVAAPERRPAASADPDGCSVPSLIPPVETRPHQEEVPSEPSRVDVRPQVRIISRPDVVARRPSGTSRDGARPVRGRDGDAAGRDGRRPSSPRGDGRGIDRGRDAPRTPRPMGTRPVGERRPGGVGMPLDAPGAKEGQSKKKLNKNKNRHGNDFMQQDGMPGFDRRHDVTLGSASMDDDDMPRVRGRRRAKTRDVHPVQTASSQPIKAAKRKIRIEEGIKVADLAHQMGLKSGEIIKVLFGLGVMATINQTLDLDTAAVVAAEFGYEVEKVGFVEEDYLGQAEADAPESLKRRPPVVTIMGHVDHGKTSLLDAIRSTHVTSGEAGGITQHIGAYDVKTKNGEVVFLDTPGHAAFTAMRARGAQVTDMVILVVAADDGVMEQTKEAINHSRAAGVPIMVAVNKMDKPEANPDRVLRELADLGLVAEEWGGDTIVAKVSARTHQGLDEMLELLALQAEILDLKANPDKPARGHIVEAKLDKGRGPVATVLIQEGTLHQGDPFVCGVFSGRVRAMFNDQGRKVKEAGPSHPVEVQGFEGVPEAGEAFVSLDDEKLARRIAEARAVKQREKELAKESRVTLENFLAQPADAEDARVLNLVVKADVQGSVEAIVENLKKQCTDKVVINVIHGGAGAITESDILLASASQAIVIGFNVRPTAKVKAFAEQEGIDIRFYDIIYKLVDEVKSAMAGLLAPVAREEYLGQAEIRQIFNVPKVGTVAGCFVTDGKITRSAGVRLLRDGVVVHTGKLASLKRFKDDAKEILKGYECGMSIESFNDVKPGDIVEAFETVQEAATL